MTALTDLETPAVTVHLAVMEAGAGAPGPARHQRPPINNVPNIGKMQMAAGAVGITCQKLGRSRSSPTRAWLTTY